MKKGHVKLLITILLMLLYIYFYPRFLIEKLGDGSPWTSYLYQYGLGLVVFLIGMWLILKTGALKLGRGRDSYWFKWLVAGFIVFAGVHAVWILLALNIPFKGGIQ